METITKYGDVGTPERHTKFGGVRENIVDGQLYTKGVEDVLDIMLEVGIFSEEQYNGSFRLCRDYKIGELYKWREVKSYLRGSGLPMEDAEEEREKCRRNFKAAVQYNRDFLQVANLAHIRPGNIDLYEMQRQNHSSNLAIRRLRRCADKLVRYYCTL